MSGKWDNDLEGDWSSGVDTEGDWSKTAEAQEAAAPGAPPPGPTPRAGPPPSSRQAAQAAKVAQTKPVQGGGLSDYVFPAAVVLGLVGVGYYMASRNED